MRSLQSAAVNALSVIRPDLLPAPRYESMCRAIAECHSVDEIKDYHDKARALEVYAKQAKNTDAERKASEIRLRAERRSGELLAELARADVPNMSGKNGHEVTSNDWTQPQSQYSAALDRTGMSRQTAHRYQQLAAVPSDVFEDALRDPVRKPTTNRLIQEARDPIPRIPDDSLWIWGRARDFERDGYANKDPRVLFDSMTETMQVDMRRLAPLMADFFNAFCEVFDE